MENPVEAWVLMALVNKDIDDFDYKNALLLAERLHALDKTNDEYKFLYAKCLFLLSDYNGSYSVLKTANSIPCRNLFAKSCLELGNQEQAGESMEPRQAFWREGVKALTTALDMHKRDFSDVHYWGDDLASVMTRSHMPSRGSMGNLLGELYAKLENIQGAAHKLWDSLADNPFKLSAYTALCDIAPDVIDFKATAALPNDIFKDFSADTVHLEKKRSQPFTTTPAAQQQLPRPPSTSIVGITFKDPQPSIRSECEPYMPSLRHDYQDVSLDQLRFLVFFSHKLKDSDITDIEPQRHIEKRKDMEMDMVKQDIDKMKAEEAYKNKHGLHKKPPAEKPQHLHVDLMPGAEAGLATTDDDDTPQKHELDTLGATLSSMIVVKQQRKKRKKKKKKGRSYFGLTTATDDDTQAIGNNNSSHGAIILEAMNRTIGVLRVLANGYIYHSFYRCREAALVLQELDDAQYDTARVLCILGKAYYDAGDYQSARVFFRRAFWLAPWFCDGVPIYSTCLWYLENELELNLLAYKMKQNRSHRYEAFIAAGNWSKCAKGGNEASKWFQKAVEYDPSRSYGHALLGYEEWEKGNCLGAKLHFANCKMANRRSYLGWYGLASAYQGMEQFVQAKGLLNEAVRLHPCHPVLLGTMAEVTG
ncbi:hypothetical protein BDB00DRAFT_767768 [Zychaea mexicana]|uniref:uncharacterized protein n=1 Tax=Zychaea mexicana TaxID=64656 RepID=UPI0022FF21D7|nr:uncharacterized protein BDB00DRAFT_767768 [Zychaea mexicana]KAI9491068.1 hypothetical protein BDB00DRAFT_767768 [Zychaea mexicana]